ncbi:MAG: oligosaccharide flippase family protein [Chthoniobacter sp.]|nr:oligosaccharide flippase family protein [Chthoniobacter sp.]
MTSTLDKVAQLRVEREGALAEVNCLRTESRAMASEFRRLRAEALRFQTELAEAREELSNERKARTALMQHADALDASCIQLGVVEKELAEHLDHLSSRKAQPEPQPLPSPSKPVPKAKTLRQKTKHGLLWAGGEAGARFLLQFGVLSIMARLLTPKDYGDAGAAMVVVGISTMFSQLGVGPALVQRTDLKPAHHTAAFHCSVLLGVLVGLAVWLGAPLFAALFRINELADLLRGLSVIFPIAGLAVVSESCLQRAMRFDVLARIEVISSAVGLCAVGIPLAWTGHGAWALVWAQIGQTIVKSVLVICYHPSRPGWRWENGALHELLHFGSGLTLSRLANYVGTNGDNFVVGRWLGAEALGVYSRAYQLMTAPAALMGNVLDKVLFPAMAKVQDSDTRLAQVYTQGTSLLALVMLPASAMIYLLAPEMVAILLGPKWGEVSFPLQIFSVVLLFRTSMKLSSSVVRAKGQVYQLALSQVYYGVAVVGLAAAGLPWGIPGVCAGVLVAITICFLIMSAMSLRMIHMRWRDFLAAHLPALRLTSVVGGLGWLATSSLRGQGLSPVIVLVAVSLLMLLPTLLLAAALPRFFLGAEGEPWRDKVFNLIKRRGGSAIQPSHP